MTASIGKKKKSSLFEELDALVDQSIDSMSPVELEAFETKRKRIMSRVTSDGINSDAPRENDERGTQVLQA
jgi:hypothetical protein